MNATHVHPGIPPLQYVARGLKVTTLGTTKDHFYLRSISVFCSWCRCIHRCDRVEICRGDESSLTEPSEHCVNKKKKKKEPASRKRRRVFLRFSSSSSSLRIGHGHINIALQLLKYGAEANEQTLMRAGKHQSMLTGLRRGRIGCGGLLMTHDGVIIVECVRNFQEGLKSLIDSPKYSDITLRVTMNLFRIDRSWISERFS